jgi:O-antigen/teichoic acid export membrane protein
LFSNSGHFEMSVGCKAALGRVRKVLGNAFIDHRGLGLIAASGAIAPGLAFLAAPFLTRLYSPAEFGVLATLTALFSAGLSVVNLRYEVAIPLPENDSSAYVLTRSAILIGIGMSILVSASIWALAPYLFPFEMRSNMETYFWWVPISLCVGGAMQALTQFAVRCSAFLELARARLIQGISGPAAQIGAGLCHLGTIGLLIGQLISQTGGIIGLWRLLHNHSRGGTSARSSAELLSRYINFPRISLFPAFVNALGLQLPILVVAKFHGIETAGLIGLVFRIFGAPVTIIASAATQVALSEGGRLRREGRSLQPLFAKMLRQEILIALPLLMLTPCFPWMFRLLFGLNWAEAGTYSLVLGPAITIHAACSPFGAFLDVLEQQKLHFLREIVRIVLICAAVSISFRASIWFLAIALSAALILIGVVTVLFAAASLRLDSTRIPGKSL